MRKNSLISATLGLIGCAGIVLTCACGGRPVGLEVQTGELEATRIAVDLVERARSAVIVRETRFIDIGSVSAVGAQIGGWSDSETDPGSGETFVWAIADRAVFETTLLETDLPNLHLRCHPFLWDGAPDQRLRVAVNGREIGATVLKPGFRDYSFSLPKGTIEVGLNRVEFGFDWTAAPADHLPGNDDRRTLAAAFQWVSFGPPAADRQVIGGVPSAEGSDLVVPPSTGLRYRLTVPQDAVLDFGVSGRSTGPGLHGLIWVTGSGEASTSMVSVDPAELAGGRVRLKIDSAVGEVIELGIATTGESRDGAALIYQSPRILGSEAGTDEIASVLLIEIDTLRADFVGAYGADVDTPNIDALASKGVLFSKARSHIPITGPSHASLFTSLLPMEHGVINNAQELTGGFLTMAESLRTAGRQTAAVISLGVMQRQFGFDRGFDHYGDGFPRDWMKNATEVTDEALALADDSLASPYLLWTHYSDPHEPYAPPNLEYPRVEIRLNGDRLGEIDAGGRGHRFDLDLPPGASELEFVPLDPEPGRSYRFDTLLVDDSAVEIEALKGWRLREKRVGLPTYQTQLPATLRLGNPAGQEVSTRLLLTCKQLLRRPEIRQRYAEEVEYADREIGRLLAGLEERGLMDNTLVIFASDHGEGLGDHDHIGHVSQLYDTLLHVPLVFVWPGQLPEGMVIEDPVSLVDVFPSVADLLGLARPAITTGVSLSPLFSGEGRPLQPFLAATYPPESASAKRAIVLDGHKFIHSWTDTRDWVELYNVEVDPGELVDLAENEPEMLERLRTELRERLADLSENSPVEAELSEEETAHLRALGYLH